MPQFLVAPDADFTDGALTSLENVILSDSAALSGLTNGVSYRAIALSSASPVFTPENGFAPAIDQPIVTHGDGSPTTFPTLTQHRPLRLVPDDNTSYVDQVGDPKFGYPGTPPGVVKPRAGANARIETLYMPGGTAQGRRWDLTIETVTSSRFVGLSWTTGPAYPPFLVFVNGRPISAAINGSATANAAKFIRLEFPDNRPRKIKVILGGHSLDHISTEAAYPPVRPASAGTTLAVIGDSLSAGAGSPPTGATAFDTWPQFAALMLGFDHCCNASIGGTRWVQAGADDVALSYFGGGRLPLVLSMAPSALIFAGSRNDNAVDATIQASAETALTDALAVMSPDRIFVAGTFTALRQNAPVRAAALARGVHFIDMQDGFQAGDIGVDGVHPTYDGAVALRNRIVPRLRAAGCVP